MLDIDSGMSDVRPWQSLQITFEADRSYSNPYMDVDLWVDLKGPGFEKRIYGFWDGGNAFRIRLVATAPGEWSWKSGSNQDDPWDLGGQITIWLDGEEHTLTRSSLIFVPAGARHCPIRFDRIDSPIFFTTMSPSKTYDRKDEDNEPDPSPDSPKCTIVSELTKDFSVAADGSAPPPPPKSSDIRGQRVLHLEDDVVKGSFYVDFVWIYEGNGGAPAPEHDHEWEELIAMAGCDPEHPNDLGGTMSIVLGDETHYISKSSLVCIPKNLRHCPWLFHDIKKPTLVFTAGPSAVYTGSHKQQ